MCSSLINTKAWPKKTTKQKQRGWKLLTIKSPRESFLHKKHLLSNNTYIWGEEGVGVERRGAFGTLLLGSLLLRASPEVLST